MWEVSSNQLESTSQPLFGSATQRVLVTQWLPLRDDTNKGSQVMNVYSLHQYQKEEDRYRYNSSSKKLARETCQETTGTEPCAQKWHQDLFPFFVNRSKSFKLQIKKKSKICLRIFHYRSLTSHEKISPQLVYVAYRILINYECDIKWTLLDVK